LDKKFNLKIAKRFAKNIRKKFPDAQIIFYGSRFRGDHLYESDFDFIIVSDYFKNINFYKRIQLILELWNMNFDIEPLCYTKKEFEKKKNQISIVSEALKNCIIL